MYYLESPSHKLPFVSTRNDKVASLTNYRLRCMPVGTLHWIVLFYLLFLLYMLLVQGGKESQ